MDKILRKCPELIVLPEKIKDFEIRGHEMILDTVLLITSLDPEACYTVKCIAHSEEDYRRLYGFLGNRAIEPDGTRQIYKRQVNLYWGATLINALPTRERLRVEFLERCWRIWLDLQEKGPLEARYQSSRFITLLTAGDSYYYRMHLYRSIRYLWRLMVRS